MVDNLTNLTSAENLYDLVLFANEVTGNIMGIMLIVVIFVILISLFIRKYEIPQALLASSFICFGLSVMLRAIGLLDWMVLIVFLTIMAFTALIIVITKK